MLYERRLPTTTFIVIFLREHHFKVALSSNEPAQVDIREWLNAANRREKEQFPSEERLRWKRSKERKAIAANSPWHRKIILSVLGGRSRFAAGCRVIPNPLS
jgi:hypothetical protein